MIDTISTLRQIADYIEQGGAAVSAENEDRIEMLLPVALAGLSNGSTVLYLMLDVRNTRYTGKPTVKRCIYCERFYIAYGSRRSLYCDRSCRSEASRKT